MKSIAIDCSVLSYSHGGLAHYLLPFLRRLLAEYHDVLFILVMPESADTKLIPAQDNIKIIRYDDTKTLIFGRLRYVRSIFALSRALNRARAGALFSPYYAFFISPRYKNKSVITIHDTCFWDVPKFFSIIERCIHKAAAAWNTLWVKEIFTVSQTSRERILRNIPGLANEKVVVISNTWEDSGIPEGRAPAEGPALAECLKNAPPYLFVCAGGYAGWKNTAAVLKALKTASIKAASGKNGAIGIVCTGNARGEKSFWSLADALGVRELVFAPGVISETEMLWLYQTRCAAGICMSIYEGFGRSLVDAMRVGLPLICSDIPTNREVAGDYPEAYCGVHDTEALSNAMLAVLDKPKKTAVFDRRFSFDYNWKIFKTHFDTLIGK